MSSDEELFLNGGDAAMTQLVGRFEYPLFRFLLHVTGDAHLAEDLFQETFLRLHRARGSYDSRQPLKPYLYRIALNAVRDARARGAFSARAVSLDQPPPSAASSPGSTSPLHEKLSAPTPDPQEDCEQEETRARVRTALAGLPETEREVVLLRVFEGVTFISDNAWFANVPLNPDGSPTPVSVTQNSSLVTRNSLVTWQATDLAGKEWSNDNIAIRKGDALLLTATGEGSVLTIDADGNGVDDYAGAPEDRFPFAYTTAGTFTAEAKIDGASVGTLQVTVMSADLTKPIACQVGYTREKNVVVAPFAAVANVVLTSGDMASLAVAVKGPFDNADGQGTALYLTALKRGTPVLVARLGSGNGPIITCKEVDEYTIEQDARAVIVVNGTTEIGTVTLTMRPYIPELVYHFEMFASQSTFAGGLTYFEANSTTFQQVFDSATGETVGILKFDIEAPPVAITACYRLWVTQVSSAPQEVGRAGPTENPTILLAVVAKLVLPVGEHGTLGISAWPAFVDPSIKNPVGPFDVLIHGAGSIFWAPEPGNPPYVAYSPDNPSCVFGSTELYSPDPGYYTVYIGGATFPEAILIYQLTVQVQGEDWVGVNTGVTFTASAEPYGATIDWSGGGEPQTATNTSSFTTTFNTPGKRSIAATANWEGASASESAEAIWFELDTETKATAPSDRSRRTIGVGEEVTITS